MISDTLIHILAAIGGIVVIIVVSIGLYFVILVTPLLVERVLKWAGKVVFHAGGGRTHEHEDGERWPNPPYDRIWIELRWLQGVAQLAQKKLGVVNWVGNPAERPDMNAFYEAREEARTKREQHPETNPDD